MICQPLECALAPLVGLGFLFEDGGDATVIRAMPIRAAWKGIDLWGGRGTWLAFPKASYGDWSSGQEWEGPPAHRYLIWPGRQFRFSTSTLVPAAVKHGPSVRIHLGGARQPSPLDAPGRAPWPGSCLLVGFAFCLMACDCPCEDPGDWSGLISVQRLECKCSPCRTRLGDGLEQVEGVWLYTDICE